LIFVNTSFLHQRPLKNGPGIKGCLIGLPEAPAVFIFFLDWQVKQQMDSAFLVFDLIGRNAGLELKCNAGGCIHLKFDDGEEADRLVVREKGQASSSGQSLAKGDGAHQSDFVTEH
jgi:hypothetical protein